MTWVTGMTWQPEGNHGNSRSALTPMLAHKGSNTHSPPSHVEDDLR
jgi:hypothetical protein